MKIKSNYFYKAPQSLEILSGNYLLLKLFYSFDIFNKLILNTKKCLIKFIIPDFAIIATSDLKVVIYNLNVKF